MGKTQVESILGPASTAETKDMVIFKRTTYGYEDGAEFILVTFKNGELDSKEQQSLLTTVTPGSEGIRASPRASYGYSH